MGLWEERIETSPALTFAREAKQVLEAGEVTSPEEQDHLNRLLRIVELVESTLSSVDPTLVSDAVLAALGQQMQQGRDHLQQWKAGAGPTYLTNHAVAPLDAALGSLGSIPVPVTMTEASGEIASLRRSVGQHRGQVDREIEALRAAGEQARNQFGAAAQQAETRTGELEAEIARLREETAQL
ncbi:MAG: hypothetical protein ACRDYF_14825, partial [Acidimicrobiia bacterium]